ncbi:MAG TPA: PAS domain S-box protein [Fimbriimonas sp.]|nr:PAS domain S-box protein [Fimbriimonas sp.]
MNHSEASHDLSSREQQILMLAAKGLTDAGIAQNLGISTATVGTYWARIRSKQGPHSRTELVAKFLEVASSASLQQLREENEKLAAEMTTLAKSSDSAKAALEVLRRVLQNAPEAILLVNEEGIIEFANEEAESLFGYGKKELNGTSVAQLVPTRYHGKHREHRRRYISNPSKKRMGDHYGTAAVRKDGTEILTATSLSASKIGPRTIVTVFVRQLQDPVVGEDEE